MAENETPNRADDDVFCTSTTDKMASEDPPKRTDDSGFDLSVTDRGDCEETPNRINDSGFNASVMAREETPNRTNDSGLHFSIKDKMAGEETPNWTKLGGPSSSITGSTAREETPNRTKLGGPSSSITGSTAREETPNRTKLGGPSSSITGSTGSTAREETPNRTDDSGLGVSFDDVDLSSSFFARNRLLGKGIARCMEETRLRRQRVRLHAENTTSPRRHYSPPAGGSLPLDDDLHAERSRNDSCGRAEDGKKKKRSKERKKLRMFYNENEPSTSTPLSTQDDLVHPDLSLMRPLHHIVGTPSTTSGDSHSATHPKKEFLKRAFQDGGGREDSVSRSERPLQELQETDFSPGPLGLYTASPTRSPRKGLLPKTYTGIYYGTKNRHMHRKMEKSVEELQGTDFSPNRGLFTASPTRSPQKWLSSETYADIENWHRHPKISMSPSHSPQKGYSAKTYTHHDTENWPMHLKINMFPTRSPQKGLSTETYTYYDTENRHMHPRIERSPSRSPRKRYSTDNHYDTENQHMHPRIERSLQELQENNYSSYREGLFRASPTRSPQKGVCVETSAHRDIENQHTFPRVGKSPSGSPQKGLPTGTHTPFSPDRKWSSPRNPTGRERSRPETPVPCGSRTVLGGFPELQGTDFSSGPFRLSSTFIPSHRSPKKELFPRERTRPSPQKKLSPAKRTRYSPRKKLTPRKRLRALEEFSPAKRKLSPRKRKRVGGHGEAFPAKHARLSPQKAFSGTSKLVSPRKRLSPGKYSYPCPKVKGRSPRKPSHTVTSTSLRQEHGDSLQSPSSSSDPSKHTKAFSFTISSILGLSEKTSPSRNISSPDTGHVAVRQTSSSSSADLLPRPSQSQPTPREGGTLPSQTSQGFLAFFDPTLRFFRTELVRASPSLEHASGSLAESQSRLQPPLLALGGLPDQAVGAYPHLAGMSDPAGGAYGHLGGAFGHAGSAYAHPGAVADFSGGLSGHVSSGPTSYLGELSTGATDLSRGVTRFVGEGSSQSSGARQREVESGTTGRGLTGSPVASSSTVDTSRPSKAAKPRTKKTTTKSGETTSQGTKRSDKVRLPASRLAHLSLCLPVHARARTHTRSFSLFVSVSVCLSVSLSYSLSLSLCLSVCLVCLSRTPIFSIRTCFGKVRYF